MCLGDTVERVGHDRERLGGLSDIDVAGLPVVRFGVVLGLGDRPGVLDSNVPEGVGDGLDPGGDVLQVANGGIGRNPLAVGTESRRVIGLGSGDVELVDTATRRAFDIPASCCPVGGLREGSRVGKAQGGEGEREKSGELHYEVMSLEN